PDSSSAWPTSATRKSSTNGNYYNRTSESRTPPPTKPGTFHPRKKEQTRQRPRELIIGRRRVGLNFSERKPRILQTPSSNRRITPSLQRTRNRAEKSRKLSARVSSRAKSPKNIQRRPSRSSRIPQHFLDSYSLSLFLEE